MSLVDSMAWSWAITARMTFFEHLFHVMGTNDLRWIGRWFLGTYIFGPPGLNCMVNSLKSMRMGPKVLSQSSPNTMVTTALVDRKYMRISSGSHQFRDANIFTTPSTFHGATIANHDLEIIDYLDIAMSFLGNVVMNKIMGAATIN